MALITLKSRKEPFEVPNERAKKIKARWGRFGCSGKAAPDDIVDFGMDYISIWTDQDD